MGEKGFFSQSENHFLHIPADILVSSPVILLFWSLSLSHISHTKTCQLFPAKIEILDLIEFFVDLKNPKIHPDPFFEGLL